jgi:hypothetical protein
MNGMRNEMTYNGNHLFHYTTLDSGIKIILSNTLRFGNFENMNDIAEVRRELYDNIDSQTLEGIIAEYQAIDTSIWACDAFYVLYHKWRGMRNSF